MWPGEEIALVMDVGLFGIRGCRFRRATSSGRDHESTMGWITLSRDHILTSKRLPPPGCPPHSAALPKRDRNPTGDGIDVHGHPQQGFLDAFCSSHRIEALSIKVVYRYGLSSLVTISQFLC
jgi:hypothetical protein